MKIEIDEQLLREAVEKIEKEVRGVESHTTTIVTNVETLKLELPYVRKRLTKLRALLDDGGSEVDASGDGAEGGE